MSSVLARPLVLALLIVAPLWAQEASRITRRQVAIPRDLYFDFDAQTVLSRARVGELVADIQVVRSGQSLSIVPLAGARVSVSEPVSGDALARLLESPSDEPFSPQVDSAFYVRTDRGNYARARVLYVDLGLSMQEALEVGLVVSYQQDGTPRFPEPVVGASSRYADGVLHLSWQGDGLTKVWRQGTDEESWQEVGEGQGSLEVSGLEADTPYRFRLARWLPQIGESEPSFLPVFTANGVIWGEASWSQDLGNGEVELRFDGTDEGPADLRLRTWGQLFVETSSHAGIVRVGNGMGTFYDLLELPQDGFRSGSHQAGSGDIFAFRDRFGRTGKLLVSTENWWSGRVIYALSKDGASRLPGGPAALTGEVSDGTGRLSWGAMEGAVSYRVYSIEDLGLMPELHIETAELQAEVLELESNALLRYGVSWIDAAGRESGLRLVNLLTFPESWHYGTFTLTANKGYDFAEGKVVDYTGNEEVDVATWDSEGYSLFGSFGLAQPYNWDATEAPPAFGRIDLNAREYLQNVQQNVYLDPNGPSVFWIKTSSGDFVQARVVSRTSNMSQQMAPMGVVQWEDGGQQGEVVFEYVFVHLDTMTRMNILASSAVPLSEKDVQKIPALIDALEASPEERDKAEAALIGMGTGVVPLLKLAMDEGLSVEAEFRVLRIIDELWNQPVAMMDEWGMQGAVVMPVPPMGMELGAEMVMPFADEIFEELGSNPWEDAAVDEFASYTMSSPMLGAEGTFKVTVTEVGEDGIELEAQTKSDSTHALESVFVQPGEWLRFPSSFQLGGLGLAFDEAYSVDDQELEVGGTTYDCKFVELPFGGGPSGIKGSLRIWYCPDVPVFGMVKLELDLMGTTVVLELDASGAGDQD